MTYETKKQLRAEAVERLNELTKSSRGYTPDDVLHAITTNVAHLRYLLTDDEEILVHNEASDDELFRCSYCHCKVYNISMTEGDCGWGFTFCPQCGGEVDEHDSRKIESELGEPTNGTSGVTNVIAPDVPLDEPPEGDAVSIMRWYAENDATISELGEKLHTIYLTDSFAKLADMVERDYVLRSIFDVVCAQRDNLRIYRDEWENKATVLEAERDEWKAKAEALEGRLDKRTETMRRLAKLIDVTPEAEYSYNGEPQFVIEHGDFGELATLVFGAVRRLKAERDGYAESLRGARIFAKRDRADIERLTAERDELQADNIEYDKALDAVKNERDEWRAKAEQAQESYFDAKHDRDAWHERYVKLQGSSKDGVRRSNDGVRRSMSNIEWLYEGSHYMADVAENLAMDLGYASGHAAACAWLMSEHVDEPCTESYMDADAEEQSPRSREADSDGRVSSDGSEVTFADLGHSADMSQNAPDCVRDDGEVSEADTREKLEADMRWELSHYFAWNETRDSMVTKVLGWLDRQAAITRAECERICDPCAIPELAAQPDCAAYDEIAWLKDRVDELTVERDECAEAADAAAKQLKQLEADLKYARKSRDHWMRVASNHGTEILRLKEQLESVPEYGGIWPRWCDGAPIKTPCEIVYEGKLERIQGIKFTEKSTVFEFTGVNHARESIGYPHGCTFERPPVIAADGEPIEEGQVLYGVDGRAWEVYHLDHGGKYPVHGMESGNPSFVRKMKAGWLTHERPASQELTR